jgi:hypothetical protein
MKQITATLADDQVHRLEELAKQAGLTLEDLVVRSIEAHLERVETALTFDPVGAGMWENREQMHNSTQWVDKLREQDWRA